MRFAQLVLTLWLLGGTSLAAQSPCLPADSNSVNLIANLSQLVTSTDANEVALKNSLGITVNASQLTLITTGTDCTKAKQAIDNLANTPNSTRRVHVVKAGAKRFVVKDPNGAMMHVFDNKWVFIRTVMVG